MNQHITHEAIAQNSYSQAWTDSLMNTYGTPERELVGGSGVMVRDSQGREHIDLLAGIAVNALGHAHPGIIEAVNTQLGTLGHVSNLFISAPVVQAAQKIIERFASGNEKIMQETRVFFCNSGAEANEAALKIARLTGKKRVLAAHHGFHGRTLGSLALTGQPTKRAPFEPLAGGVEFYPYGDSEYLRKLVELNPADTAAIILEPIQGETGVIPAPHGFLTQVRQLCDEHNILFIVDEVQTGVGRTGDFFAFQHEYVTPDVVTLAKGLGGGLPIGATIATGVAASLLTPGSHGTTFGGNPVVCAAANVVLDVVDQDFCAEVAAKGQRFIDGLSALAGVAHVRGRGLMLGVVLDNTVLEKATAHQLVAKATQYGLILNAPRADVIRITPPLIISTAEIDDALERFAALLADVHAA
ncbi:acetylornithine transaminase [Corynebacterium sp. sy017]|uniref:acetylornithine transaminase n=1 Tax=unclassified Corynebacterium TaxID=2624378 RepID=UPI00118569C0|nr:MULTISPECIES: acetylornithine transaminase [unclassified Corynebacterium]MBP3089187.1 acetylornithine transaminase [Corynebacterium sp. sy017]TSD91497.1 acetylornithine transaminase [Corynebacterium sp. SY003]